MYATIQLSPYIMVQGLVSRQLPTGQIVIRDNEREYVGAPVASHRKAALAAV